MPWNLWIEGKVTDVTAKAAAFAPTGLNATENSQVTAAKAAAASLLALVPGATCRLIMHGQANAASGSYPGQHHCEIVVTSQP